MPIPPFESDGLLPVNPKTLILDGEQAHYGHDCALGEIEEAFVDAHPDSQLRPQLFREVRMLLGVAMQHVPCVTLLVSGEFVTNFDEPTSVYVGLIIHPTDISSVGLWNLRRLFDSSSWEIANQEAQVFTGLSREFPPEDLRFAYGQTEQQILRVLAGTPTPDREAGYLELVECPEEVTTLAEIEGAPGIGSPTP
jgi:hypothetical protein